MLFILADSKDPEKAVCITIDEEDANPSFVKSPKDQRSEPELKKLQANQQPPPRPVSQHAPAQVREDEAGDALERSSTLAKSNDARGSVDVPKEGVWLAKKAAKVLANY